MLRGALAPEGGTVGRLLLPAQDEAADAGVGLAGGDGVDLEALLRVVLAVLPADAVSRLRDRPDAAPVAVADLEHLEHDVARGPVAVPRHGPGILVLDRRAARLELAH